MVMLKVLQRQSLAPVAPANQFKDKVVVVTGGASGIGRALCEELGRRGAQLIVLDIDEVGCQQVAAAIVEGGGQAEAAYLDVVQADQFQTVVDRVVREYGQLDYIFNNAGIAVGGDMRDLSLEHWQRVIDINLWGVIHGTRAAYTVMVKQGFGHIVNIASLGGVMQSPMMTPYATTKHAVVGLSHSLRAEAEDLGVKVSVVCPGYVRTAILDKATIVGAAKDDIRAKLSFEFMTPEQAVEGILRGVSRNQAVIVFPFAAKVLWWLFRIHPAILSPLMKSVVTEFRSLPPQNSENKEETKD